MESRGDRSDRDQRGGLVHEAHRHVARRAEQITDDHHGLAVQTIGITPATGASTAANPSVKKKLIDSQTTEPVFAYTTSASATVAAQEPVSDMTRAVASRQMEDRP